MALVRPPSQLGYELMLDVWTLHTIRRWPNTDSSDVSGDEGVGLEFLVVLCEESDADLSLPRSGKSCRPHDTCVLLPPDDCKLTTVLVEGDKDSRLLMRSTEDFPITRVRWPVARPDDIVSCVR